MIKICPRCRQSLPADQAFFAPRDKYGHLDGWCRACRTEDQKERYRRRKALSGDETLRPVVDEQRTRWIPSPHDQAALRAHIRLGVEVNAPAADLAGRQPLNHLQHRIR